MVEWEELIVAHWPIAAAYKKAILLPNSDNGDKYRNMGRADWWYREDFVLDLAKDLAVEVAGNHLEQ